MISNNVKPEQWLNLAEYPQTELARMHRMVSVVNIEKALFPTLDYGTWKRKTSTKQKWAPQK